MSKAFTFFKKLLFAVGFLIQTTPSFGQSTGNEIIGTWWDQKKEAQIEIYKNGNTYSGKIVWLMNADVPVTGKQNQTRKTQILSYTAGQ